MDTIIQAATVLAAFGAVHERLVEMLQQFVAAPPRPLRALAASLERWRWVGERRIDRNNVLLAVLLALVTHANLLELFFQVTTPGAGGTGATSSSLFFRHYLAWPTVIGEWQEAANSNAVRLAGHAAQFVVGAVLMGLATALGSKFWHDLVKGLIDVREGARAMSRTQVPVRPSPAMPPPAPPARALSNLAGGRAPQQPSPDGPPGQGDSLMPYAG